MSRHLLSVLLFAATVAAEEAASAPKAAAQVPAKPVAAPALPKVRKIGNVVVSGSIRTREEAWGWFTPDSGDPSYLYSGNIFRLSLSQAKENWAWQTEFAVPFMLGLPNNATGPGAQGALGLGSNYFGANDRQRNVIGLFPKQAFITYKHKTDTLKMGRFEFNDGSETAPKNGTLAAIKMTRINMRLLGHFAWTHVGRSFDGLHYSHGFTDGKKNPTANLTLVGGVPTRGVFQTDGWGWNEAAFGYGAYTKMWGKGTHAADTRVLGMYYTDWRDVLKTDARSLALRRGDLANPVRIGTFGGHSVHAFDTKAATYDLLFWGVGQTGKWGNLDHRAYSVDIEGGFQPKAKALLKLKPWLRGGYSVSSGDDNPADGKHGTFFQVMPTPRPFARFPFFNMMNNNDLYTGLTLRPSPKVSISTEFHSLALNNRNDLWYAGGGAFQPWSFGYLGRNTSGAKSLANLYDASVDLKFNAYLSMNLYFGHAQGLSAIRTIYPKGQNGNFGFVELLYKF